MYMYIGGLPDHRSGLLCIYEVVDNKYINESLAGYCDKTEVDNGPKSSHYNSWDHL